jgi:hypothetical protein
VLDQPVVSPPRLNYQKDVDKIDDDGQDDRLWFSGVASRAANFVVEEIRSIIALAC